MKIAEGLSSEEVGARVCCVSPGRCSLVPGARAACRRSSLTPPSGRYLSFAEREDIALLSAQGLGVRAIARHAWPAPLDDLT